MPAPSKWERVANTIREEITSGRLKPGDELPTYTEMATTHRVSLSTLRLALLVLRREGLIEGRPGERVWVAPAPD